ncbi:hypothetical protein [Ruegeria profundi]|uniref:Uncharacterized protein n=1 Tax=Ruegeria profundi TaxID=1685378 RepID=A0A0X3TRY4_9RHOB|nr:hypothetical protein [Ruegeria profundi]KUJ77226.1 hypothetical protein AVO44_17725 [Ruegeria profundi]
MFDFINQKDPNRITVLADHQIQNRRIYREHIWAPARAMHEDVGSYAGWRRVLVEIEDYDGRLYFPDGRPFKHLEIYELFKDVGNRWMGLFLEDDGTGLAPKRYASTKTFDRVRIIGAYCAIHAMRRELAH